MKKRYHLIADRGVQKMMNRLTKYLEINRSELVRNMLREFYQDQYMGNPEFKKLCDEENRNVYSDQ